MAPIKGTHYLTQGYGKTAFAQSALGKKLYKNWGGEHKGLDFGTHGINLPVISTVAGRVVTAKLDGNWGNHVEVLGEDGWRRQWAHLQSMLVKVGDVVEVGQELGRVGSTGASTAVHLHFGQRKWSIKGWQYRDPSIDLSEEVEEPPKMPTSKLIKSSMPYDRAVYIYNGSTKFPIPDWQTKVFLFGAGSDDIELVEPSILSKIPEGEILPSLK